MVVEIIQTGNPLLRKTSKEVLVESITKPKIQKILADMNEALDSQYDGVAIAAPQIGINLRIFIISGKAFDEDYLRGNKNFQKKHSNKIFINPIIKKISKDRKLMDEGCLSVRPIYGKVRRATRAIIEAYDKKGHEFTQNGSGLIAHIFQHETDHLEGVLFTDEAQNLREVPLEENSNEK